MIQVNSRFVRLLCCFCLFLIPATVNATGKYDLRLKSGTFTLPENVQEVIADPSITSSQVFHGKYFRLIQFYDVPSMLQRHLLASAGIELTSYLSSYTYHATIDANADLKILQSTNVRSISPYLLQWKMNSRLLNKDYPEWAVHNQKHIDITVRYSKSADHSQVTTDLELQGAKILRDYEYGSWCNIRVLISEIETFAALPYVMGLEPVAKPPTPDDERGRSLHRSNVINTYSPMGRHYDGSGVVAALADDGPVGPHIDYQGRIDQSNTTTNSGNHGDMTAGILMGGGNLDPTMRGMGTGAFIYIYDIGPYNHILNSPVTNQTLGVMVTSTSYSQGCNEYTTDTQTGDQILNENPTLLHVFSAGNNGTGNCGYGGGNTWGNITGGYKQGKNVIACGNLNYLDVLETSSSRGPAEDGRIKPDICANGAGQMSTDGPNDYQVGGGTSAACPGIAGIVTQLHHAFRDLNSGQNAEGALIKACLLNTADELGNPGPDFKHGWGRVNAFRAVTTLEDGRYNSDSVIQGEVNTHTITVPAGTKQLRIMCYWSDVEGDPLAVKALVNDLNMVVADPSSINFDPWVLDHTPNVTTLNNPATRGVDALNNMEQVTIDNPAAGIYTATVTGFLIPQGPQKYYIVYEFLNDDINVTYPIGYEGFVPGETETIRWNAFDNTTNFTLEYSTDLGATWNLVNSNIAPAQRSYNWTVPNVVTAEAMVRITRGATSGQNPEPFNIIGVPQNIQVTWACPDSVRLTWNPVNGAVGYEVSMLGNMYMDSVAYSTTTDAIVSPFNPTVEHWFSVRAYPAVNKKGRRSEAIYQPAGTFSCPVTIDASASQVVSPSGLITNCIDLTSTSVSIEITNPGINPISSVPVYYSVNGGPVVSETYTGTINPSATASFTFNATYDFSLAGNYTLTVWTGLAADGNHYNDTIASSVTIVPGTLVSLPYSENFETFINCSTANNCEQTVCPLSNGWINESNQTEDNIDWRTNEGGTPSADTGPDMDHNPGNTAGNYLYLEASACFGMEAVVISPCIDLTTATGPEMKFWYHMFGDDMGVLHVDLFYNDAWQNDVIPPQNSNMGNLWHEATINLAPYAGQIVNVRFRGITGAGFMSDMAIDDISIYEVSAPPVTNFSASATSVCIGQTIFLNDVSQNSPTSWNWTITPSTGFTFVNGTSASSQNPQVQFTTGGSYDISLTTTNAFGSSNVTIPAYIQVDLGALIPLIETFQAGSFPPVNWSIDNGDGNVTWALSGPVTGSSGAITNAAYMNNFVYNAVGQEDGLTTERMDFTTALAPILTFDVAYARYNDTFQDGLRIDISTDCGQNFIPSGYLKIGDVLATVPDQNAVFAPANANQWRNDTLDLTAFAGQKIMVRFVAINGYGNTLYIDNINYHESPVGISEHNPTGNVMVYPNPGNGLFDIVVNSTDSKAVNLKVYDVKGALMLEQDDNAKPGVNRFILDLRNYGKGVYLLEINSGEVTKTLKLIVM